MERSGGRQLPPVNLGGPLKVIHVTKKRRKLFGYGNSASILFLLNPLLPPPTGLSIVFRSNQPKVQKPFHLSASEAKVMHRQTANLHAEKDGSRHVHKAHSCDVAIFRTCFKPRFPHVKICHPFMHIFGCVHAETRHSAIATK